MGRDEQLGGERVYRLALDWDVIRQSFVRGNKVERGRQKTTTKTKTRQPEGDGLHHEDCANGSPALPSLVSILCLPHSRAPAGQMAICAPATRRRVVLVCVCVWKLKVTRVLPDCSLQIKSAALFLRAAPLLDIS